MVIVYDSKENMAYLSVFLMVGDFEKKFEGIIMPLLYHLVYNLHLVARYIPWAQTGMNHLVALSLSVEDDLLNAENLTAIFNIVKAFLPSSCTFFIFFIKYIFLHKIEPSINI